MAEQKVSFKEINRLAIPSIFAGIVEPLISLTDTAVAGKLPQDLVIALGAIGLVGSFLSALVWIFSQSSNAISAQVSRAVGQGNPTEVKPLVSQLFFFNLLISIILSGLTFIFAHKIFVLYGAQNELLSTCIRYFNIRVWGFPLTLLTYTLFGVFRGFQNTSWAMIISIIGGIINIALNLYFVFGLNLSVEGIAWASLIAQFVIFILTLIFLYQKTPFKLYEFIPKHPYFLQTLRMAFDLLIRTIFLNLALFLAMRTATQLGKSEENEFVAAHAILVQIWLFSAFLLDGYANAANAISGKLLGERAFQKLKKMVGDIVKVMISVGIILAVTYFILYQPIGRLLTKSDVVLAVFYQSFWIVALMQPLNAVAFLFDGVYKGLGETKVLRNVFILAVAIGFIPALFLTQYWSWGLQGIWLSFVFWVMVRAGGLMYHFRFKLFDW